VFRQTIILLGLLATTWQGSAETDPGRTSAMLDAISPIAQEGDLLFKGASTAVWTELAARWSTGDKRWGHVGIVTHVPETCCAPILVVHADTGDGAPGEEIGEVRAVSLETFLSDVDQAGLYRLDMDGDARQRMVEWVDAQARARIPFDRGYSIESENNLYCTELVWRGMSIALRRDAIPDKSRSMGRTYIALSDLSTHPLADEIMVLDWRE
jgi:hypothetical protein